MPIAHLQTVANPTKKLDVIEYIQETMKNPFSWRALLLSLGLGIIVAVIVTGVLLGFQLLANKPATSGSQKISTSRLPDTSKTVLAASTSDKDQDGLYDWQEVELYNTSPYVADTDFDGFSDGEEVARGYDPTGFGRPDLRIKINSISVDAPISFPTTRDEIDIQAAMAQGVAYYPDTAFPGQAGNAYLTGHSSDYAWNPGDYKRIFRKLNDLVTGDRVIIEQTLNSGQIITYEYEIYTKQVTQVDDPLLWQADRDGSILTLVTSWPIDSTRERLMVRASLIN